nr:uncharacterized protein in pqqA 5'region-like [Nerophis lumbriciformis]
MKILRRVSLIAFALSLLAYWLVLPLIANRTDAKLNSVIKHVPYSVSAEAAALHSELRLADLHGDALLWRRDLLKRHTRGHIDLPRLTEGGFALQVFPSVTKSPSGLNYQSNSGTSTDQITLLAVASHWPVRTWNSLYERARFHAERLNEFARQSDGSLRVVRTQRELRAALTEQAIAGILATEGAHPLEGDLAKVEGLFTAGYRVIGLQHFFDNRLGGSLHGIGKGGLSDFGRQVVHELDRRKIVIDVAHSSEAVVRDVLAISQRPLIVSHTGIKSLCDTPRNISDELLQQIAARGGLIGIGFWDGAICDISPQGIARTLSRGIELLGHQHLALGSDFDGTVTTALDASEMVAITNALLDVGVPRSQIRAVMGENAIEFFLQQLPQ